MKRTKIFKRHYDYREFDTNIPEYVAFVVQTMRSRSDQCCNIVNDYIGYLEMISCRCSYQMMYNSLYQMGYNLSEIKQYYNQLNDILKEHNNDTKVIQYENNLIDRKLANKLADSKNALDKAMHIVDEFGICTIENDDKKYVLTNAQVKKGKR